MKKYNHVSCFMFAASVNCLHIHFRSLVNTVPMCCLQNFESSFLCWFPGLLAESPLNNIFIPKGIVSVILSDPPCKDDNTRFTTVPLKALSD